MTIKANYSVFPIRWMVSKLLVDRRQVGGSDYKELMYSEGWNLVVNLREYYRCWFKMMRTLVLPCIDMLTNFLKQSNFLENELFLSH